MALEAGNTQAPTRKASYVHGFDVLRAIFSVFVVLVHLGYVAPSKIFEPGQWHAHRVVFSDVINFYLLLAAVPVFYLIASFLAARNASPSVWPRVLRSMRLLVFWGLLLNLYQYGVHAWITSVPRSPVSFLLYLTSGFQTAYYFFFSLTWVLLVAQVVRKWPPLLVYLFSMLTTVVVGLLPILAVHFRLPQLVSWSLPLNFLPYPFLAIAIERLKGRRALLAVILLTVAGLFLTRLDWTTYPSDLFFQVNSYALPVYARPSLICFSTAIVLGATLLSSPAHAIIRFMSSHSLALYCLHPFTIWFAKAFAGGAHLSGLFALSAQLILVLALCYLGSSLLLPLFLRRDLYH